MDALIRPENDSDITAIFEVNQLAFKRDNEARLVDNLRQSEHYVPGLSLVAEIKKNIVGHILFTKLIIRGAEDYQSLCLAPMAVHPEYQKQGIGGQLIKEGIKRAREQGFPAIIVLGHPRYYPRFGFVPASRWSIRCPYDPPDEVFMAMELQGNGLFGKTGTVVYPEQFEAVD